jgi:SAM-dependent methyltransferase
MEEWSNTKNRKTTGMKKRLKNFYRRFLTQVIVLKPNNISNYFKFFKQLKSYKISGGKVANLRPILGEDSATTGIDSHYFWQAVWLAKNIQKQKPEGHVDVASQVGPIGVLSAFTKIFFVDIRPIEAKWENLVPVKGSVLELPFKDGEIKSLSSLHVIEHIGLGRYGDTLDPNGTKKACVELSRVLSKGGHLYISLPIGKERTEFNAHRIHFPKTIIEYFNGLKLLSFSAVNDKNQFIENANINDFDNSKYSCGMFEFTKI